MPAFRPDAGPGEPDPPTGRGPSEHEVAGADAATGPTGDPAHDIRDQLLASVSEAQAARYTRDALRVMLFGMAERFAMRLPARIAGAPVHIDLDAVVDEA